MDMLSSWGLPVLVVGLLGAGILGLALLVGRWIDAQSNSVVDDPRQARKRSKEGDKRDT